MLTKSYLAAFAVIAACSGGDTVAPNGLEAAKVATGREDVSGAEDFTIAGCDGSELTGVVTIDSKVHFVYDPASGFNYQFVSHDKWSGTVSADDGTPYTFGQEDTYVQRFTTPLGAGDFRQFTHVTTARLIGSGPIANKILHLTDHVTITPNGQVTANVDVQSVECH